MTISDDPQTLVSAAWLADHLTDPGLRLRDALWYMPTRNRDARAEYAAAHLPEASFVDVAQVAALTTDLPHRAALPEKFAAYLCKLNIGGATQPVRSNPPAPTCPPH